LATFFGNRSILVRRVRGHVFIGTKCQTVLCRTTIRDGKPQSVAELVEMSGRAQPNLTRSPAKMASAGFITMKAVGHRKAPSVAVKKIVVEINPYSDRDRLQVA
jgi:predicted transcriptional regulator